MLRPSHARKRLAGCIPLLLTLVAAAGCASLPAAYLAGDGRLSTGELPAVLAVWSWNLHKGQARSGARIPADHGILEKLDRSDLVLLQEACVTDTGGLQQLDEPLARRGFGWWVAMAFESDWYGCGAGQATGVATAARVEPRLTLGRRSRGREFGITPKTVLAQTFAVAGVPAQLLVINAHLLGFELVSHNDYRRQLRWIAARIAAHTGPVILAGDLNTHNQYRMALLEQITRALCLQAAFIEIGGRTRDFITRRYPLDHIYHRGLLVIASETGNEESEGLSDHNSLFVEFATATDGPGTCVPVNRDRLEEVLRD